MSIHRGSLLVRNYPIPYDVYLSVCAPINWRLYTIIRREHTFCTPEIAGWVMMIRQCTEHIEYIFYARSIRIDLSKSSKYKLCRHAQNACDLIEFIQRKSFIALLIIIKCTLQSDRHAPTHTHTISLKILFWQKFNLYSAETCPMQFKSWILLKR